MEKTAEFVKGSITPSLCIIGAGFAGMTAAIDLQRKLNLNSYTIYEEHEEVGGTWLVNKYPGCACDVPSHMYSWSFELNPDWPDKYANSLDILEYMKKVARKYDLYSKIKFNTQVKSVVWNETKQKWTVTTFNKITAITEMRLFNIVISATGILRTPSYPKEFESFKGQILHSAEWVPSVDLTDKIVAVVGSGASAIQIIPAIASKVKEMHCYQRKPAWVLPRFQGRTSKISQNLFRVFPALMLLFRTIIFLAYECFYFAFTFNSWTNTFFTKSSATFLKREISIDQNLQKKLLPKFPYGCKRALFHDNYYSTMALPHVKLHTGKIVNVENNKINTVYGSSPSIDVLILATGFRVQDYFDPTSIVGKNSVNLVMKWMANRPEGYLGIFSSDTPNYFILHGPNAALGHNSAVFMIECQSHIIMQVLQEMIKRGAKSVQSKKCVEEKYMANLYEKMKEKVWVKGNCDAWYSDAKGNIIALYPWTGIRYWWQTRSLDLTSFQFD